MADKDLITVTGVVGTEPTLTVGASGTPCSLFRLGSTARKLDPQNNTWSDGDTNWYSIVAFRRLAANIQASLHKGDRVLVNGRLRVQEWTGNDGRSRITVEILADSVGPDLTFGVATISRNPRADAGSAASTPGSAEAAPDALPPLGGETGGTGGGIDSDTGPGAGETAEDDGDRAAVLTPF